MSVSGRVSERHGRARAARGEAGGPGQGGLVWGGRYAREGQGAGRRKRH